MAISLDTQEKAKEIILTGLRAQSHGPVRFNDIDAQVRRNAEDEEFLDVIVFYDGKREDLNVRRLNSLHSEIEPQLLEIGILHIPSVSYTDRESYDRLLSETAAACPWDRQG